MDNNSTKKTYTIDDLNGKQFVQWLDDGGNENNISSYVNMTEFPNRKEPQKGRVINRNAPKSGLGGETLQKVATKIPSKKQGLNYHNSREVGQAVSNNIVKAVSDGYSDLKTLKKRGETKPQHAEDILSDYRKTGKVNIFGSFF